MGLRKSLHAISEENIVDQYIMKLRISKIDKLLVREFLPPFLVAFGIAQFVLTMQFLWLYIDDIAGKGVGFFLLVELIYYMSLTLFPLSLPIAVLLASVMVYGSLAEKYELASMKSAGIPLMRTMRSSMIIAGLIAFTSYLFSDYVIPYANLKAKSRLYDIKKQKPALYLEPGVFNEDFQGHAIRIGSKSADNRRIKDVMIDDDQSNFSNRFNILRAKDGEMFITPDDRFFVMKLEDGHQYQKLEETSGRRKYPFVRTNFETWTKVFDLGEFDINRTGEDLFKTYHEMLSIDQLEVKIDTIRGTLEGMYKEVRSDTRRKMAFATYDPALDTTSAEGPKVKKNLGRLTDSLAIAKSRTPEKYWSEPYPQTHLHDLMSAPSVVGTFDPAKRIDLLNKARSQAQSSKNKSFEYMRTVAFEEHNLVKHRYLLHSKYGQALVCFIFLFIGAPMGAIVRKGGFGYPLLVAIIFFMVYIVLSELFEKLAKNNTHTIDPVLGAWMPCIILFPIGLILTIRAMNDSKIGGFAWWPKLVDWVRTRKRVVGQ
ncbi:MAG: LptF/LptG family permease [Saprospiraceae bacterium]|nr:LptF/LptG family permease [Saprospiraceae bacterium]